MKHLFTFIAFFTLLFTGNSQRKIWQFEFSTDTVYVRTDTAFVMFKTEVEIPEKGHVIARIEGNISATGGDVITLGVSDYERWNSNFGNASYSFTDSSYSQQQFTHTMVYEAEAGIHDFFAVMHNWTDRNGSGNAIAQGKMVIEFVPDNGPEYTSSYKRYTKSIMVIPNEYIVLDSIVFQCHKPAKYHVGGFLKSVTSIHETLELALSYRDIYGVQTKGVPATSELDDEAIQFNLAEIASFSEGEHTVYLVARKANGDITSSNNAVYGTFFAVPLMQNDENLHSFSHDFNESFKKDTAYIDLAKLSWTMPENGQLMILVNGYWNGSQGDKMSFSMDWNEDHENTVYGESFAYAPFESYNHFTINQVIGVQKNQNIPLLLKRKFSGEVAASGSNNLIGSIRAYLISEETISSTQNDQIHQNSWVVYPNPAGEALTISQNMHSNESFSFSLISSSGQFIRRGESEGSKSFSLDVDSLTNGVYYILIHQKQRVTTLKFVVLH